MSQFELCFTDFIFKFEYFFNKEKLKKSVGVVLGWLLGLHKRDVRELKNLFLIGPKDFNKDCFSTKKQKQKKKK